MVEYIERENYCRNLCWCNEMNCDKEMCPIWEAPAADVAPVRHGRWVGRPLCGNAYCRCSECGAWSDVHASLRGVITQKYCTSCGAKMDGDGEDGK